jgi:flagellar motor switch protein FliN/FliY
MAQSPQQPPHDAANEPPVAPPSDTARPAASAPDVHVFREIARDATAAPPLGGLDRFQEIPVHLSVELGRTSLRVRDLLALAPGTVIELERLAGEPVDVLINDRLVAQGEVVTVNAKRGVRFTDVMSPDESSRRRD